MFSPAPLNACGVSHDFFGRGELSQHGALTILNDGYNANPQSFASAMALAQGMRAGRRLVFVAGTMRELGDASAALHAEVATELAALAPEVLALVGDFVRHEGGAALGLLSVYSYTASAAAGITNR